MSAGGASGGQGMPTAPPTPLPSHALALPPTAAAGNPLLTAAREQKLVYMELLSQSPYKSDPILAQQVRRMIWLSEFFHNLCWQKKPQSLFYNAAEKSIILTNFKLTIILS